MGVILLPLTVTLSHLSEKSFVLLEMIRGDKSPLN